MAQCNWDPAKHNGKSCPVHGASGTENNTGHKLRINGGKYQVKYSDSSDYEDTDKETYEHLRETALQDFDENVEDDFGFDEEKGFEVYKDKIKEEIEKVKTKEDAEYVSDLIDDNMEAGYISEEMADELYNELDKKIDEFSGPDKEGPSYAQLDAMKKKATYTDTFGDTKEVNILEELEGPNGKKQYKVEYPDGRVFIKDEEELDFDDDKIRKAGNEITNKEDLGVSLDATKNWKDMSREEQKSLTKSASELKKELDEKFYEKGGLNDQMIDYINKNHRLDDEELSLKLKEYFEDVTALSGIVNNAGVGFLGNTMPDEETNRIVNDAKAVLDKYKNKKPEGSVENLINSARKQFPNDSPQKLAEALENTLFFNKQFDIEFPEEKMKIYTDTIKKLKSMSSFDELNKR